MTFLKKIEATSKLEGRYVQNWAEWTVQSVVRGLRRRTQVEELQMAIPLIGAVAGKLLGGKVLGGLFGKLLGGGANKLLGGLLGNILGKAASQSPAIQLLKSVLG